MITEHKVVSVEIDGDTIDPAIAIIFADTRILIDTPNGRHEYNIGLLHTMKYTTIDWDRYHSDDFNRDEDTDPL